MSVSVRIVAQRKLTRGDLELVDLFNRMCEIGIMPDELVDRVSAVLGEKVHSLEPIKASTDMIETYIEGAGDVMSGDGMRIKISDLPTGTVALRIYAT